MSPAAERLKAIRIAAGLSQGSAAKLLFTPLRTYQYWEGEGSEVLEAIVELLRFRTKVPDQDQGRYLQGLPDKPSPDDVIGLRNEAGLDQGGASAFLGVGERNWYHWEKGTRNMRKSLYAAFLVKLRCPASLYH